MKSNAEIFASVQRELNDLIENNMTHDEAIDSRAVSFLQTALYELEKDFEQEGRL